MNFKITIKNFIPISLLIVFILVLLLFAYIKIFPNSLISETYKEYVIRKADSYICYSTKKPSNISDYIDVLPISKEATHILSGAKKEFRDCLPPYWKYK